MQRSATSCFAKHIAAFLVRPFGEYPAFLVLTALLPLVPDIIRFFLNARKKPVLRNPAVPLPGLAAGTAAMPATARQGGGDSRSPDRRSDLSRVCPVVPRPPLAG